MSPQSGMVQLDLTFVLLVLLLAVYFALELRKKRAAARLHESGPPEEAGMQVPDQPPPDLPRLQEWLAGKARPALRMHLKPTPFESLSPVESHLGGPPFWPEGEPWPVCGQCDRPLTFIGQVRLDGEGAPRVGSARLLTFYYCLECFPWGPDDASAYHLRLYSNIGPAIQPSGPPPAARDPEDAYGAPIPCRISLAPTLSVPHFDDGESEIEALGLEGDAWNAYEEAREFVAPWPEYDSRLGGYPDWIQYPEWPSCPECGERMRLIWQLDSEREAGLMWGDAGKIYIFACPRPCSENALALVMQCY